LSHWRSEQKNVGKSVSRATGDERGALVVAGEGLAAQVKTAEAEATTLAGELDELLLTVPNIVEEGALPAARTPTSSSRRSREAFFDFEQRHLELGDCSAPSTWSAGPRCSGGPGFFYLTGAGARSARPAQPRHAAGDRTAHPHDHPGVVKPEAMAGTGFLRSHALEV